MIIYNTKNFPFVEFGKENKREIRIVISPYTTGEERVSIVHCTLPGKAISEGHIHEDCDEYIYFDIGGKAVLDGKTFDVPPQGIFYAKRGSEHECVNIKDDETLNLVCFFVPPLSPYGQYPELIKRTKEYLRKQV